jgi:hypothetical protein
MGWEEIIMLQRIISKAVSAVLGLGAMTTAALAEPLGSASHAESRSVLKPVAFIYDGQQTLFTNIPNFALFLRQDPQGNLFAVDPNNIVWVPVTGLVLGQSQGTLLLGGLFWQPSGAYGAPFVYDGGFNALIPWAP